MRDGYLKILVSNFINIWSIDRGVWYLQDNWDPDWQSTSSSKVAYLIERLKDLSETNNEAALLPPSSLTKSGALLQEVDHSRAITSDHEIVRDKVLIFSQFLEHIHVIEQQVAVLFLSLNSRIFLHSSVLNTISPWPVNHCGHQICWDV